MHPGIRQSQGGIMILSLHTALSNSMPTLYGYMVLTFLTAAKKGGEGDSGWDRPLLRSLLTLQIYEICFRIFIPMFLSDKLKMKLFCLSVNPFHSYFLRTDCPFDCKEGQGNVLQPASAVYLQSRVLFSEHVKLGCKDHVWTLHFYWYKWLETGLYP